MVKDYYIDSSGKGMLRCRKWCPETKPVGVLQLVHGIAEHIERYNDFAQYMVANGFVVVGLDHMGHGKSIGEEGVKGYFYGGWIAAVDDTLCLMNRTKLEHPDIPYVLFGHSMGSFITRTLLAKYSDCGIAACVISGTGWMPNAVLSAGIAACKLACKMGDEKSPNKLIDKLVFGSYNNKVEHPRTQYDWLSRDPKVADAYILDPLCGFMASAGLIRDMLGGILWNQRKKTLCSMDKTLPVLFVSGGDDPVGNFGQGVRETAKQFCDAGMSRVTVKIYPLCRHEVLNEINKSDIYADILHWVQNQLN